MWDHDILTPDDYIAQGGIELSVRSPLPHPTMRRVRLVQHALIIAAKAGPSRDVHLPIRKCRRAAWRATAAHRSGAGLVVHAADAAPVGCELQGLLNHAWQRFQSTGGKGTKGAVFHLPDQGKPNASKPKQSTKVRGPALHCSVGAALLHAMKALRRVGKLGWATSPRCQRAPPF